MQRVNEKTDLKSLSLEKFSLFGHVESILSVPDLLNKNIAVVLLQDIEFILYLEDDSKIPSCDIQEDGDMLYIPDDGLYNYYNKEIHRDVF